MKSEPGPGVAQTLKYADLPCKLLCLSIEDAAQSYPRIPAWKRRGEYGLSSYPRLACYVARSRLRADGLRSPQAAAPLPQNSHLCACLALLQWLPCFWPMFMGIAFFNKFSSHHIEKEDEKTHAPVHLKIKRFAYNYLVGQPYLKDWDICKAPSAAQFIC